MIEFISKATRCTTFAAETRGYLVFDRRMTFLVDSLTV